MGGLGTIEELSGGEQHYRSKGYRVHETRSGLIAVGVRAAIQLKGT